jgi:hypothetical protein
VSEWWTYTLSDFLLFAPSTYYRLFELYNRALWPAQLLALGAGGATLALLRGGDARSDRAVAGVLAVGWLWVAWGFHFQRYATINWAAPWFAAAFAIEAALLAWIGAIRGRLRFGASNRTVRRTGVGLVLFALVGQPLIGPLAGRDWVQAELFGLAPDPTAAATLGVLALAANRVRWELLLVPLAWCAVTGATLWAMGAPDALVMPLAGLLVLALSVWRGRSMARAVRNRIG